jgi:predicted DNA-binding protein with PD1-like motif
MKSRLVWQADGERTFVLVLGGGDEAFDAITAFATKNGLGGALLTALGASGPSPWAGSTPPKPTADRDR